MVFHMSNMRKHRKLLQATLILLTLSLFLVCFSPVNAQESASLTEVISDEGVDTDDDGLFDYLKLGIEVNVTVSGTYTVSVEGISNSSYTPTNIFAENTSSLDVGVHVVYLSLNGSAIYESGVDPFAVNGVNVYDENDTQLDVLAVLQLSQEYSYVDFQHEPDEEAVAVLTGVVSDVGVDTDDDGLFNYLRVGIGVNVTVPGTYVVSVAGIHNTSYASYTIFVENTTYLDVGENVVYLNLDGMRIYLSGLNPTGVKGGNLYDENDTQIDAFNDDAFSKTYSYTDFQPAVVDLEFEVERDVFLDQVGSVYVTVSYRINNLGFEVTDIAVGLPEGAYDFVVRDEMGELDPVVSGDNLTVTLRHPLNTSDVATLYVAYHVPWENCVSHQDGIDYSLDFSLCEVLNSTIKELSVSVFLPEGAEFKSSTPVASGTTQEGGQKVLVFTQSDVEPDDDLGFVVNYKHLLFWDSLYPTVWVGIIVVAVAVLSFFWKAPSVSTSEVVVVPSKDLRSFVSSYEEKMQVRSELVSLEELLQKGKIPRRKYKVRRRMLEGRLSTINRNLSSLSDVIRSGGSQYAGLMRQIEAAEAKLDGAERDLQRVESRYKRGEISRGAYGKLVDEYKARIEDAVSMIDGVLLRLRE